MDDISSPEPDFLVPDFFVVDECIELLLVPVVVEVSVLLAQAVTNASPIKAATVEIRDRFMIVGLF